MCNALHDVNMWGGGVCVITISPSYLILPTILSYTCNLFSYPLNYTVGPTQIYRLIYYRSRL